MKAPELTTTTLTINIKFRDQYVRVQIEEEYYANNVLLENIKWNNSHLPNVEVLCFWYIIKND
jgi:hypothetical protein